MVQSEASSVDERTYAKPGKPPTGHNCKCRADIDDRIPQNAHKQPRFAFGQAGGTNCEEVIKLAKKRATHALGAQPKHTACKCNPDC